MPWQEIMQQAYRNGTDIAAYLKLDKEQEEKINQISERYPMFINSYYASLIDVDNPNDPIRRMSLPDISELDVAGEEDTSGENDNTVIPGMQHKYGPTVLILSTQNCSMYCRHCFRKRMVGLTDKEVAHQLPQMVEYIRQHPEITNVLISGGDSLLNSNRVIGQYLELFSSLEQLDFIRFGTRIPVVLPQRISEDQELLDMLAHYAKKKRIYVITQFNHPREITDQAIKAIEALMCRDIIIKNQTVLLKGVNDDPQVLGELLQQLTKQGVIPYYIFQCRPARGVQNHFQVPILQGIDITDQAKGMQNGLGKAVRYVMSHRSGKIEILGRYGDEVLFKYHQAKEPQNSARIFSKKITTSQCWLNDI